MAQVVPIGFLQKNVSSGSWVGNIVTNGLVLNLDAGNTASYPGSGTTWTDLSGNGNSVTVNNTFSNSVANGSGAFDFLGSSNNTIVKSSINGVNSSVTGGISIETWVKHTNVNQYQFWASNAATSTEWALKMVVASFGIWGHILIKVVRCILCQLAFGNR